MAWLAVGRIGVHLGLAALAACAADRPEAATSMVAVTGGASDVADAGSLTDVPDGWAVEVASKPPGVTRPVYDAGLRAGEVAEDAAEDGDDGDALAVEEVATPIDVLPEPIDAVPEPIDTVPGPIDTIPEPIDAIPAPIDVIPAPIDAIPEPIDAIPEPIDAIPGPIDTIPGPIDVIPEPIDVLPGPIDVVSAPIDVVQAPVDAGQPKPDVPAPVDMVLEPIDVPAPPKDAPADTAKAVDSAVQDAAKDTAPPVLDAVVDTAAPAPDAKTTDSTSPAADAKVADAPVSDAPVSDAPTPDAAAPDAAAETTPPADVPPPPPDVPDAADSGPADAAPPPADAAPPPADTAGADVPPPTPQPQATPSKCGSPCSGYASPVQTGKLKSYSMNELSGLAASRIVPGVLWSHNDTGDDARIFALNEKGYLLGQYLALDVTPTDWEDLAVGPCPAGQCVFVGDIGDNPYDRDEYQVWRIVEPVVDLSKQGVVQPVVAQKIPYVYPGGKHVNAETLMIHPTTGDLYVVSKHGPGKPSTVYRIQQPYVPGQTTQAVQVAVLDLATADSPMTGGSIHPCGQRVLLRTYKKLFQLTVPTGGAFEAAFTQAPLEVPVASEVQGEAVGWRWDGLAYYTVSEAPWQPIWMQGCLP